jgi:AcrR family transcriptional regulator
MARLVPADRIEQLVRAATEVFIDRGFQRTQMADIAEALGVAKGTLYLYVESKDALFDLACRNADHPFVKPQRLPVPTPRPRATMKLIAERLGAAMASIPAIDAQADLATIVAALYDTLARNRVGLKLVDRSARELPELAVLWFGTGRMTVVAALDRYLTAGIRAGRIRPVADAAVAARFIVETCAFWAVHRHWDAAPQSVDDATARSSVIDLIGAAFAPLEGRMAKTVKGVPR